MVILNRGARLAFAQERRISPLLAGILRPLRTCNAKAQNDGALRTCNARAENDEVAADTERTAQDEEGWLPATYTRGTLPLMLVSTS